MVERFTQAEAEHPLVLDLIEQTQVFVQAGAGEMSINLNWRGTWMTATEYYQYDMFHYQGSGYITVTQHTSGVFATDLADGKIALYALGGDNADTTAIHDNEANEISAITEKVTPVAADILLIEDSAAAYIKKKVQITNLPGGGGAVDSVNGYTGVVVLDADDIAATASRIWFTSAEQTKLLNIETGAQVNVTEFGDDVFKVLDNVDATKEFMLQLSGITTGTTRTFTVPDYDGHIGAWKLSGSDISFDGGSVGVNTNSPSRLLEIQGRAGNLPQLRLDYPSGGSHIELLGSAASVMSIRFGTAAAPDSGRITYNNSTDSINFVPGGNLSAVLNSSGDMGVGVTVPLAKLHVKSSSAGFTPLTSADDLFVEHNVPGGITVGTPDNHTSYVAHGSPSDTFAASTGWNYNARQWIIGTSATNATISIRSGGYTEAMFIDATQHVGINEPTPGAMLHVKSAAATDVTAKFVGATGQTAEYFRIEDDAGANVLTATTDGAATGRIGIGTDTPARRLEVVGEGANQPICRFTGFGGSAFFELVGGATSTAEFHFGPPSNPGRGKWIYYNANDFMVCQVAGIGTHPLSISAGRAVGVNTPNLVEPTAQLQVLSLTATRRVLDLTSATGQTADIIRATDKAQTTNYLNLKASGKLGINEVSPGAMLHAKSAAATDVTAKFVGATGQTANVGEFIADEDFKVLLDHTGTNGDGFSLENLAVAGDDAALRVYSEDGTQEIVRFETYGSTLFSKYVGHADEVDNGSSGAAATITWRDGNHQLITFTASCTLTLTAPPQTGILALVIVQGGTGSYTATWPASVKWAGSGTAPTLSTGVGEKDIVYLYFDGTDYNEFIVRLDVA